MTLLTRRPTVADRLAGLAAGVAGGSLPVRLRAWDGSEAGPSDGPTLVIRDRAALRRLLWHPGELGLAQAYIAGEIDVEGDLADGLRRVWRQARERGLTGARVSWPDRMRAVRTATGLGVLGPRPAAPSAQARLDGQVHTRERDRAAISYHYDLSNEFYQLILDPAMAYSCGYWTGTGPEYGLAEAQRDKLDLICRKLGLAPGMRLLDVGCGWGSLSLHAARHYGVTVTGVTLSARQRAFAVARAEREGLSGAVDIRLQDYRDIADGPYDAVASVEMGEHVGADQYPTFAARLHDLLAPCGRLLIQQMSRGTDQPGGGAFIESYVAPDMHMRPVGETVSLLAAAGLEIRDVHAMREHYVRTVDVWARTLEERWSSVVELVGEPVARVWRLYLAGGALTFAEGRMGVDQILAVRRTGDGVSGMPPVRV
ncbi:SAM-dependent methyltransferase [Mangrovihabitans endophyticus]|uniref:Cyclopropane-fatty-acyl-phospholipid synthase n=1 Tax=Mangrovihabitans endophyticus TaxID=1751298 RepID=A0A8J3FM26_9ACTN|nr:cyclopropane-fatty-acyl-phospholipid synthase family protein [Mangrovihabitans endophyticus]GGK80209.1 cyclopropane-fatty-acyl-phospholipid synthase [Mangrovihabitans endophyticus]